MKKNQKNLPFIKLFIIFIVVGVAAVPRSFAQTVAENEASAVATLRSIAIAQGIYRARTGIFASNGTSLVKAGLINSDLGCIFRVGDCLKNGYNFRLSLNSGRPDISFDLFAFAQREGGPNATGNHTFYVNERGIIYISVAPNSLSVISAGIHIVYGAYTLTNIFPYKFDINADGRGDIAVFRPSNGIWFLQPTLMTNFESNFTTFQFGSVNDKIVPADYDGDGKTDHAVYRNGFWYYVTGSTSNYQLSVQFGEPTDIPVPGDYDGDVKTDVAVYRPSTGVWYVKGSRAGFFALQFGQEGDKPVAGDFDGDGKADFAVFRPSEGIWYIQQSSLGFKAERFGVADDKLVAADYDGDGKMDIAVYRPSDATWYLNQSSAGMKGFRFGISTDAPVPADYNGDGKTDIAVFRDGMWYIWESGVEKFRAVQFGSSGDIPVPSAFVR